MTIDLEKFVAEQEGKDLDIQASLKRNAVETFLEFLKKIQNYNNSYVALTEQIIALDKERYNEKDSNKKEELKNSSKHIEADRNRISKDIETIKGNLDQFIFQIEKEQTILPVLEKAHELINNPELFEKLGFSEVQYNSIFGTTVKKELEYLTSKENWHLPIHFCEMLDDDQPEKILNTRYFYYAQNAQPREVDAFDTGLVKTGNKTTSKWFIFQPSSVKRLQNLRTIADIYFKELAKQPITPENINEIKEQVISFYAEEDKALYGLIKRHENTISSTQHYKNQKQQYEFLERKAKAQEELKILNDKEQTPRHPKYEGIAQIVAKVKEVEQQMAQNNSQAQQKEDWSGGIEWL